jgi:hypothetical protein
VRRARGRLTVLKKTPRQSLATLYFDTIVFDASSSATS